MASSSADGILSGEIPASLAGKFSEFTISLSGNFPSKVTHAQVRRLIIALGGTFETTDITKCTHLIASSKNLRTAKVRSARESECCQIVSYDWLLEAIPEASSGIKELLDQLASLEISEKPQSNKRKLEAEPDVGEKVTKTETDEETSGPVEIRQNGKKVPLNSSKLNQAVRSLLSLMSSREFETHIQTWIAGLPTARKNRPWPLSYLSGKMDRYLHALQRLNASLDDATTDVLYRGLLSLQLTELTALNKQSEESKIVAEYHSKTVSPAYYYTQPLQIVNIFRIERHGEKERFEDWSRKHVETIGDRRLVWHGSGITNFVGILNQGLLVRSGGVWFAERSEVSLEYCHHTSMGVPRARTQCSIGGFLMLLCELECGKYMHHLASPIKSGHPKWRDAGCVHPDLKGARLPDLCDSNHIGVGTYVEYVARDQAQIRQRYLIHFKY